MLLQLLLLLLLLLAALELAESVLVCLHVAVIGQIWIIGSTLVLERLDGCGKVDFALEEFLTGDLVEFVSWVSVGGIRDSWVVWADSSVLVDGTELHSHLIAAL